MKSVRELNGYRLVYEPNHPKAMKSKNWLGYVYEHIIIAEEGLNRSISKTEIVHHLNGDRSDNYPDNLIVIEESQHRKIHAWIERGALYKTEEPNNKHCKVCSKPISRRSSKTYCSIKCSIINTQSMHPHPTCEFNPRRADYTNTKLPTVKA